MLMCAFSVLLLLLLLVGVVFVLSSATLLLSLMLWAAAIYLTKARKTHWIASLSATFMTAVVIAFILQSDIGFGLAP